MCQGCFDEAGQPKINSQNVLIAALAAKSVYEFGAFHIVVSDWNVENSNIFFCMDHPNVTPLERAFGRHLLTLSEDERTSALALAQGYWEAEDVVLQPEPPKPDPEDYPTDHPEHADNVGKAA